MDNVRCPVCNKSLDENMSQMARVWGGFRCDCGLRIRIQHFATGWHISVKESVKEEPMKSDAEQALTDMMNTYCEEEICGRCPVSDECKDWWDKINFTTTPMSRLIIEFQSIRSRKRHLQAAMSE